MRSSERSLARSPLRRLISKSKSVKALLLLHCTNIHQKMQMQARSPGDEWELSGDVFCAALRLMVATCS